jgi:hypothetical protein
MTTPVVSVEKLLAQLLEPGPPHTLIIVAEYEDKVRVFSQGTIVNLACLMAEGDKMVRDLLIKAKREAGDRAEKAAKGAG